MYPPIANPTTEPTPPKFGEADLIRRSASTVTPPAQRQTEVAKLIDVSKCIGCKACQTACLAWNDLEEEVGVNVGVYENPHDLTPNTWTLMRYTEWKPETGNLEWLIRKDGCMHCEDRVASGMPVAWRHCAVFEWNRRFHPRELHWLRLLREGLPLQ